jgi:hypothetical protein
MAAPPHLPHGWCAGAHAAEKALVEPTEPTCISSRFHQEDISLHPEFLLTSMLFVLA